MAKPNMHRWIAALVATVAPIGIAIGGVPGAILSAIATGVGILFVRPSQISKTTGAAARKIPGKAPPLFPPSEPTLPEQPG